MKALTLTQPWAGLVAAGIKRIENRSRATISRADIGQRFGIHASRVIDEAVYARIRQIAPDLAIDHGHTFEWRDHRWVGLSRITSAVIATAVLADSVRWWTLPNGDRVLRSDITGDEVEIGDQARWFFGPIGYVLRGVHALAEPVRCRGWQGFWTLPEWEAQLVEEQVR